MKEERPNQEKIEALPPQVRANMLSGETSIFFNVALFEQAQRIAQMFASSTMVPEHFRGNIGNCMIGLNYAARIKGDPFMVFQTLYVIHGRPGIEGKLVEAVINQSNKYSEPLQYLWLDPEDKEVTRRAVLKAAIPSEYGCQAFTIDKKSGKRVDGPKITWALVHAEGWNQDKKNRTTGEVIKSKWNTMPEMMFYYRSASWFSNKNCPELKLGMHTVEELHDTLDLNEIPNGTFGSMIGKSMDMDELIKQFDASVPPKTHTGYLNTYLKMASDTFEKPIDEIKAEAAKDLDGFWSQFDKWVAQQSSGKDEPPEKEDPIRKQYIGLRKGDGVKTGLKPWIMSHLEYIPKLEQKYQDEIREKWIQFYTEPYPHMAKQEEPPPQEDPLLEEHIKEGIEDAKAEKEKEEPVVPCMLYREGDLMKPSFCKNACPDSEKCADYRNYKDTLSDTHISE